VNKIFVRFSVFVSEERSSHWMALLMFEKAKVPEGLRSWRRFWRASWGMTLETNEELLLTMLFLGLRLFDGSLESLLGIGAKAGLSPPNTAAVDEAKKEAESVVGVRGFSWAAERWLLAVTVRTRELSGSFLEATTHSESLVP
jgi:hypothetical protein